jgi:tyrosyl-tRNA synthetase
MYHGEGTGESQVQDFLVRFSAREFPEDTAERLHLAATDTANLQQLLIKTGAAKSSREAQRLAEQKAIKVFGEPGGSKIAEFSGDALGYLRQPLSAGEYKLKIGKTRFLIVNIS